jgi:hypothetical protein
MNKGLAWTSLIEKCAIVKIGLLKGQNKQNLCYLIVLLLFHLF